MRLNLFREQARSKYLLLPIIFMMAFFPAASFAEGELPSRTSEESAKRGLLIKKLFPMPDVFDWEKHEVSFKECWYERPAPGAIHNLICFRLRVDQSTTQELEIQKSSDRSIEFREEGSKGKILLTGTHINYPLRNFKLKQIRKGMGEILHWIEIKEPDTKQLKLRIYTMNHKTDLTNRSDVVLTFDDLYNKADQ